MSLTTNVVFDYSYQLILINLEDIYFLISTFIVGGP